MSNVQIYIARQPLTKVCGAYHTFHHNPSSWTNKADAVGWLALQVESGTLTLDDIRNAPDISPAATAAAPDPAMVAAIDKKVAEQKAIALQALQRADHVGDRLTQEVNTMTDNLAETERRLRDAIMSTKPDLSNVQYEVARAVCDAFAPFRQAVKDAGAEVAVAQASAAVAVGRKPVSEVFGLAVHDMRGNELMVEVWDHPEAPAVDPDFIWTESILRYLTLADQTGDNLWFGGEKGTGKSETARQFAARTGRAFKRINFHKHTSAEEYVGAVGLVNGETVFQPKDFLAAYTSPSTVILLDEVTNADPGELAPLNGFLEPNAAVSFGGKTHRRAPGVLVFAADNTFGSGDDSGRHVGTRVQNSALIDRFAHVVPFTFLPESQEVDAIVRRTGCARELAEHVMFCITVARQKVSTGEIVDAPSIRSAMSFVRALSVLPPDQAWRTAVVARQPSESHAELGLIFAACINAETINKYL